MLTFFEFVNQVVWHSRNLAVAFNIDVIERDFDFRSLARQIAQSYFVFGLLDHWSHERSTIEMLNYFCGKTFGDHFGRFQDRFDNRFVGHVGGELAQVRTEPSFAGSWAVASGAVDVPLMEQNRSTNDVAGFFGFVNQVRCFLSDQLFCQRGLIGSGIARHLICEQDAAETKEKNQSG